MNVVKSNQVISSKRVQSVPANSLCFVAREGQNEYVRAFVNSTELNGFTCFILEKKFQIKPGLKIFGATPFNLACGWHLVGNYVDLFGSLIPGYEKNCGNYGNALSARIGFIGYSLSKLYATVYGQE